MTVFPDGTKERLHGHGYQAALTAHLKSYAFDQMVPFSVFKQALSEICARWDEKVLLGETCPFLKIEARSQSEIAFSLCGKTYRLPADEVQLLPVDNITVENLAAEVLRRLVSALRKSHALTQVAALEIRVDESEGQGASSYWENIS